jgi:hypothetical protein
MASGEYDRDIGAQIVSKMCRCGFLANEQKLLSVVKATWSRWVMKCGDNDPGNLGWKGISHQRVVSFLV